MLAKTPIVSGHDCDPVCSDVAFAQGLIELLKAGGGRTHDSHFCILQQFVLANCVGEKTVAEMVEFGADHVTLCDNAEGTVDENCEHTKLIVEQNRENGSATVACISLGVYHTATRAILLKTFPGIAAPMGSWTAAQADMKQTMGFKLEEMQRRPEEIEDFLVSLRQAREV